MKYRVIHRNGFHLDGKHHPKGSFIEKMVTGADIRAGLHFQQIEKFDDSDGEKPAGGACNGPEASAAAQKLAQENGIDLATVTGTGANGAITKPDVEAAVEAAKAAGGAGN